MAENTRDVELRLSAKTDGADNIRKLADEVRQLAKSGGDAGPEFKRLADELDSIANRSAIVENFTKLQAEIDKTGTALTNARTRADQLGTTLAEQRDKSEQFRERVAALRDALDATDQRVISVRNELRTYQATASAASKDTAEYANRVQQLQTALAEARNAQSQQRLELQQAGRALSEANAELAKTESGYKKANNSVDSLNDRLRRQSTELQGTLDELRSVGIETTDLEKAQRQVRDAYDQTTSAVSRQVQTLVEAGRLYANQAQLAEAVAASNQRAVEQARAAAAARQTAARDAAAAEQEAARETEAALLRQKLAVEALTSAIAQSNTRAVEQAKAAASARDAATAAAQRETNALSENSAELLKQKLTQESIASAVAASNAKAVQQARAAAAARAQAASDAAAAEKVAIEQTNAALLRQKLTQEQVEASAREAGLALQQAFATTGVRSVAVIREEINSINAALVKLAGNSQVSAADFNRAFQSSQNRIKALEQEIEKIPGALDKTSGSAAVLRQGFSQLTAAFGLFELGRGFIDANVRLETLRRSLTVLTGSGEAAGRQIQFLKDTADRAGLSYNALAQDFVNFTAAANTSGISLEKQQEVFQAVANAAGTLGISTDRVGLILQALAQTASKGKVSLEELQGQLGESLPGALSIVAKGFGITKAQLLELTKSGIDVQNFFDAFVRGAKQAFGDGTKQVDGFSAAWARAKNTLSETATFFGNQGGILSALTTILEQAAIAVRGLGGAFEFAAKSVGISIAAIQNFNLKRPIKSLQEWKTATQDAYNEIQARLEKANASIKGSTDQTSSSQNQLSTALQGTANAATQGGQAAVAAAQNWAQLALAQKQALDDAENQVKVAERLSDAKKIEGQSRIAVIKIVGDELALAQATAEAARGEAQALDNLAQKRQAELTLLIDKRQRLQELVAAQGDESGARQKDIEELNRLIETRQAETTKSKEAAEAARIEAEARDIAVKTYRDNSAALAELKNAYDQSRAALAAVQEARRQGLATYADEQAALERSIKAEALYRDAVKDTATAMDLKVRKAQALQSVTEAQINVQRAVIENEIAQAQRIGDTYRVFERQVALKELDLKLSYAKIDAINAEVKALQIQIAAEEAALKSNDPLLEQKKAEIELRKQNVQIKILEAQRLSETAKGIKDEIDLLTRRGATSLDTANSYVSDRGREADANDKTRASVDRLAAAEASRYDSKTKFAKDTKGNVISATGNTGMSVLNTLKGYGLNDAEAAQIAREFTDSNGNVPFFNNPGQLKYGGRNSTLDFALQQAAQRIVLSKAAGGGLNAGTTTRAPAPASSSEASAGQAVVAAPAPASTTHVVKIDLGGRTTNINTASDADAQALTSLLQQIGDAANRTQP